MTAGNPILQARERQKRFRETHRAEINARNRQMYAVWKAKMASGEVPDTVPPPLEPEHLNVPEPEPEILMEAEAEVEAEEEVEAIPKLLPVVKKRSILKSIGLNYEATLTKLGTRYTNIQTINANKREIDTLYRITETQHKDCLACLNDTNYVNALIRNQRRKNGQAYKGTSMKLTFATLVVLCDPVNGFYTNITDGANYFYLKEKNVFDAQYARETAEHNRTFVLKKGYEQLLYDAGLKSKTDKFYVFLTLYKYAVCRDNFRYLRVVKTKAQAVQPKAKKEKVNAVIENFLVLPESNKASGLIILNNYKTHKLYGTKEIEIPPSAVAIVKGYGVPYGDYLFGTEPNSTFIGQKLKEFGVKDDKVKGSLNLLRRMVLQQYGITETSDPEADARRALDFATKMGHAPHTQQSIYRLHNQPAPQEGYDVRQVLKAVPKAKK